MGDRSRLDYTILVFNQVTYMSTQPGHPSTDMSNEYWRWFRPPLGKKQRVLCNSRPCYPGPVAGIPA